MAATHPRLVVANRLVELFERFGHQQALQFAEGDERRWYSWDDLGTVHRHVADALGAYEIAPDLPVAVVLRQRPALVASELAVLAEGRTAVTISPLLADRALVDDIGRLRPHAVVVHATDWARPGVADVIRDSGALAIGIDDALTVDVRAEPVPRAPEPVLDAAVTVSTSGTTGPPKRLPVTWETFVRIGGGPEGRRPRSDRGAFILSLPLTTLGGMLSMARLVFGDRAMAMMERFDVRTWASLVKEHRPKVIGAPPPVVRMVLDADISPDHFDGVTAYVTASAAIPPHTIREFEGRYGIPVLLGYGATEFLGSVTGWTSALWEEFGASKVGSVGRPLPGSRVRAVDPATLDQPDAVHVAVGEEGILEVDPPQRAGNLPAGWLRTADRGRIDADGFVWIVGRADDLIVRGGFKVDLVQLEGAMREHEAVKAATGVGLPDERLGEVPGVVVTVDDKSATPPTEAELLAWVRDRVPPYAAPVAVAIVDAIPLTSTFKPNRALIREQLILRRGQDRSA